jgi:hypothetical protein
VLAACSTGRGKHRIASGSAVPSITLTTGARKALHVPNLLLRHPESTDRRAAECPASRIAGLPWMGDLRSLHLGAGWSV